jgi:hypothetical protein
MTRRSAVAFLFCGFIVLATASAAQQSGRFPDYCVGFSPEACQRISVVVGSKIRPAYCVPGFGRTDSGLHLSPEQLRICYAMPDPVDPESQRRVDAAQAKQRQLMDDARAMVQESWTQYGRSIETIEVGYKCGVVDQPSASFAIQPIQSAMQGELVRAGLINDGAMYAGLQKITATSIQAGKEAADRGACTVMTPADRGRLRSIVSDLMQGG